MPREHFPYYDDIRPAVAAEVMRVAQRAELVQRGAVDVMSNREHLIATVLAILGRVVDSSDELQR